MCQLVWNSYSSMHVSYRWQWLVVLFISIAIIVLLLIIFDREFHIFRAATVAYHYHRDIVILLWILVLRIHYWTYCIEYNNYLVWGKIPNHYLYNYGEVGENLCLTPTLNSPHLPIPTTTLEEGKVPVTFNLYSLQIVWFAF